MGEEVIQLEAELRQASGAKHAIAVTNCTAALHLASVALGIGPGDEVLCPTMTFCATANAPRSTGANIQFCESVWPHYRSNGRSRFHSGTVVASARGQFSLSSITRAFLAKSKKSRLSPRSTTCQSSRIARMRSSHLTRAKCLDGLGKSAASASSRIRMPPVAKAARSSPKDDALPTACGCCARTE